MEIYISYNDYGKISTIDKNSENGYYIVKWTNGSFTLQSYNNILINNIKAVQLVCNAVYLNPLSNFKQWYTTYGKKD